MTLKHFILTTSLFFSMTCQAQIITDGTVGPAKELEGPQNFTIGANLGTQLGENLFHSFSKFNINRDQTATFFGPNTVKHVISRVTGGEESFIDGGLRSEVPNADLYFINPAGIHFGPHAKLDVTGSLHLSTADYLTLADGGRFDATQPARSTLTTAPPAAFGFMDDSPAGISKDNSSLNLPDGETLSFVGGDLTLQDGQTKCEKGCLRTQDGQINLISVASPGEVPIHPEDLPDNTFTRLGKITLEDSTQGVDNFNREIGNVDVSGSTGGKIYILGGQLVMKNAYVFADTKGDGKGQGQGITIKATEELTIAKGSRITAQVVENATGNAGNISVNAGRISLTDGSMIDSSSMNMETSGNAGQVNVSAKESITISGSFFNFDSSIQSTTAGKGKGGNVLVSAPTLTMTDKGTIRSDTQNTEDPNGVSGEAGDISVTVNNLTLQGGAKISASSGEQGQRNETGGGGAIKVKANKIFITGHSQNQPSGIFSNAFTSQPGGDITVSAANLEINDGGAIEAGSVQSAGGDITICSSGRLDLVNSQIYTLARGEKELDKGGNIDIETPQFVILQNSQINTSGFTGKGGNIRITAEQFIPANPPLIINSQTQIGKRSILDASSQEDVDGEIRIDSPIPEFTGILTLSYKFPMPSLRLGCAGGIFSIGKRAGLLATPGDLQTSN